MGSLKGRWLAEEQDTPWTAMGLSLSVAAAVLCGLSATLPGWVLLVSPGLGCRVSRPCGSVSRPRAEAPWVGRGCPGDTGRLAEGPFSMTLCGLAVSLGAGVDPMRLAMADATCWLDVLL